MIGLFAALILGGACQRLPEGTVPEGVSSEGLTLSQYCYSVHRFEEGGVIEGNGKIYLQLDVDEGEVSGYVTTPSGDITIDGHSLPEDQGALITGEAWWDPDGEEGCFASAFTTTVDTGLVAKVTGCRTQAWIDVLFAQDEGEEGFIMLLVPPKDPFFEE